MIALATALLLSAPPTLRAQSAPVAPAYADRFAEVMGLSPGAWRRRRRQQSRAAARPRQVHAQERQAVPPDPDRWADRGGPLPRDRHLLLRTDLGGRAAPTGPLREQDGARGALHRCAPDVRRHHDGRAQDAHLSRRGGAGRGARPGAGRPQVPERRGFADVRSRPDGRPAQRRHDRSVLRPYPAAGCGAPDVHPEPTRGRSGEPERQGHPLVGEGSGDSFPVPAPGASAGRAAHGRAHRSGGDPPVRHERRPAAERHRRDRVRRQRQARDHRQQRGRAMGGVRAVRQAESRLRAMGRR